MKKFFLKLLFLVPILVAVGLFLFVTKNPAVVAACLYLPLALIIYILSGTPNGLNLEEYTGLPDAETKLDEKLHSFSTTPMNGKVVELMEDENLGKCFYLKQFIQEVKKLCKTFRDTMIFVFIIQVFGLIIAFTIDSVASPSGGSSQISV